MKTNSTAHVIQTKEIVNSDFSFHKLAFPKKSGILQFVVEIITKFFHQILCSIQLVEYLQIQILIWIEKIIIMNTDTSISVPYNNRIQIRISIYIISPLLGRTRFVIPGSVLTCWKTALQNHKHWFGTGQVKKMKGTWAIMFYIDFTQLFSSKSTANLFLDENCPHRFSKDHLPGKCLQPTAY